MRSVLKPGDAVQLVGTDNQRLGGQRAEVLELTDWGAFTECAAAHTGRYRAHWSEMVPFDPPPADRGTTPKLPARAVAKESGYTGDACDQCGGARMKRNGACLLCDDCGSSSGCS